MVAQQSLFDPSRAPGGKHTLWAYCHVPNGSAVDMTEAVEAQLERFAPGFRERVLARHTMSAPAFKSYNPNYVGGDINGGAADLWQLVARPVPRPNPYRTPLNGVYLCSASTPPGGGVHGMCGYHAARAALRGCSGGRRGGCRKNKTELKVQVPTYPRHPVLFGPAKWLMSKARQGVSDQVWLCVLGNEPARSLPNLGERVSAGSCANAGKRK